MAKEIKSNFVYEVCGLLKHPASAAGIAARGIDAVVLLAGGLRPSPLIQGTGLAVLDLPLRCNTTVLDHWISILSQVAPGASRPIGSAVIAYTSNSPQPSLGNHSTGLPNLRFVCDQTGLRGPAGTARDICQHLDDDSTVFLGEAARFIRSDLRGFLKSHETSGADITVGCEPDGSPAGIYLTRNRALKSVPTEGFMDLKEQWLSRALIEGQRVRVWTFSQISSYPLRNWNQFLNAIRLANYGEDHAESSLNKRFTMDFGRAEGNTIIQMPGAEVGQGACIRDSVLMPGSIVDDETIVVRSYIGPGVHIKRGERIIDGLIQATDQSTTEVTRSAGGRIRTRRKGRSRK